MFGLQEPVPVALFDSAKCMLAFHGKLGKEEDAVVGKYFLPGKIKFVEDWYRGMRGKHPWFHSTDADNYDNGFTDNSIVGDIFLSKLNIRFSGDDRRRRNESFLWFVEPVIRRTRRWTRTARTEFRSPRTPIYSFKSRKCRSIRSPRPPPGYTSDYQYLGLVFEFDPNGQPPSAYPTLQITLQDHQVDLLEYDEAYYIFKPGETHLVNIFDTFQSLGKTVTPPCYLRLIDMNQYLDKLDQPSSVPTRTTYESEVHQYCRSLQGTVRTLGAIPADRRGHRDEKIRFNSTLRVLTVISPLPFMASAALAINSEKTICIWIGSMRTLKTWSGKSFAKRISEFMAWLTMAAFEATNRLGGTTSIR